MDVAANDTLWWKHTTVYQIYPRSFADSIGDGIGDLRGIIERLPYLHELGVETLWLSPFYDSPQADFGYDIRDHFNVAKEYGSLDDTRALIDAVHRHGMKRLLQRGRALQRPCETQSVHPCSTLVSPSCDSWQPMLAGPATR